MARRFSALVILGGLTFTAFANDAKVFESFSVKQHGVPNADNYIYSEAAATEASPVVISVEGRELSSADRGFRTDLQKNWLSVNVPKEYEFRSRGLTSCGPAEKAEMERMCDVYAFVGPDGTHEYYFYVSNWP